MEARGLDRDNERLCRVVGDEEGRSRGGGRGVCACSRSRSRGWDGGVGGHGRRGIHTVGVAAGERRRRRRRGDVVAGRMVHVGRRGHVGTVTAVTA